jgi:hypothetical protein
LAAGFLALRGGSLGGGGTGLRTEGFGDGGVLLLDGSGKGFDGGGVRLDRVFETHVV